MKLLMELTIALCEFASPLRSDRFQWSVGILHAAIEHHWLVPVLGGVVRHVHRAEVSLTAILE